MMSVRCSYCGAVATVSYSIHHLATCPVVTPGSLKKKPENAIAKGRGETAEEQTTNLIIDQDKRIKELEAEKKRLRELLERKVAIAKISADNENYSIGITIKEAEQALNPKSEPEQGNG